MKFLILVVLAAATVGQVFAGDGERMLYVLFRHIESPVENGRQLSEHSSIIASDEFMSKGGASQTLNGAPIEFGSAVWNVNLKTLENGQFWEVTPLRLADGSTKLRIKWRTIENGQVVEKGKVTSRVCGTETLVIETFRGSTGFQVSPDRSPIEKRQLDLPPSGTERKLTKNSGRRFHWNTGRRW